MSPYLEIKFSTLKKTLILTNLRVFCCRKFSVVLLGTRYLGILFFVFFSLYEFYAYIPQLVHHIPTVLLWNICNFLFQYYAIGKLEFHCKLKKNKYLLYMQMHENILNVHCMNNHVTKLNCLCLKFDTLLMLLSCHSYFVTLMES